MIFHPFTRTLSRYIDGDLESARMKKISIHLEKCSACRDKVGVLEEMGRVLKTKTPDIEEQKQQFMSRLRKLERSSAPFIADIREIIGCVMVSANGKGEETEAFPGMSLKKGDTVRVLGNSLALIELLDGSLFYLNRETEFCLSTIQDNIQLKTGEFFAMMKPQRNLFQIKTPAAVLGVIGTDFDAEVTKDKKTVLRVIKGKVSFQTQAGKVIVKKKKQAEASQYSTPVLSRIARDLDITSWTHPVRPKNGKKGTIMKNLFWILALLGIVIGAIFYFQKEEKPGEDSPAKVKMIEDDNSPLEPKSPFAVQGLSWKMHSVSEITAGNSQGGKNELDVKVEVIQADEQNGSLVLLTVESMKDPSFGALGEKAMIGKKYSYRISPDGEATSPGTYDGSTLEGLEVIAFVRVMGNCEMSDLFVNKQVSKAQEWTTSIDFKIPGYPDSFIRGQSTYRFDGYARRGGKDVAVISQAGGVTLGGISLTVAADPRMTFQLDIQSGSIENQNEYYIERKTGRVVGMTGKFKEYDKRMTQIQYIKGRQEPIKRPSNPSEVVYGRTIITIEY